jgi:hypothetical protein
VEGFLRCSVSSQEIIEGASIDNGWKAPGGTSLHPGWQSDEGALAAIAIRPQPRIPSFWQNCHIYRYFLSRLTSTLSIFY